MQDAQARCRVLVLGGYGHFGARIAGALAGDNAIEVIVAGRSATRQGPAAFAGLPASQRQRLGYVDLDLAAADFAQRLAGHRPDLVIHTAGPFQGQDVSVAEACLRAGAHYVDLADGRDFVREFPARLDALARECGRAAIAGASTLPAISSAVVDALHGRFDALHDIDIVIAPAQRTPLGLATVRAVLSYCGVPFRCWRDGQWQRVVGWRKPARVHFAGMRSRLASPCDVPDHDLLVTRYPGVRSVRFRAALELACLQRALAVVAALRQWRLPVPIDALAPWFSRAARGFDGLGGDLGGMYVDLRGVRAGRPLSVRWELTAPDLHGPEIPCLAAVLLAKRLAREGTLPTGAHACMGLLTLDDFEPAFARWQITHAVISPAPASPGEVSA